MDSSGIEMEKEDINPKTLMFNGMNFQQAHSGQLKQNSF